MFWGRGASGTFQINEYSCILVLFFYKEHCPLLQLKLIFGGFSSQAGSLFVALRGK